MLNATYHRQSGRPARKLLELPDLVGALRNGQPHSIPSQGRLSLSGQSNHITGIRVQTVVEDGLWPTHMCNQARRRLLLPLLTQACPGLLGLMRLPSSDKW